MEIVVVLILTNLFILLVIRSLNENNSKYLLAGYNTMSKEERENFKIKEYLIYLKKFWNKLLLYNSLLTIFSYFFFDELGVVIVYSISLMLPLPFFIYQSNKNFKK
tara:strand:- start:26 stop:343 length:318 start_codon:yes stop_codon:yes gene_type:complete